jgi:hypothetical protein
MARDVKYVLVIPPCGFCWDRDATEEVETVWDCTASLCMQCARLYRRPDSHTLYLVIGAGREPLVTSVQAGAFMEEQTWTRAQPTFRGRPQAPHEYCLLWRATDPWMQLRVVAFIRATGERRRWGRNWHTYWTYGEHEYWAMRPRETILNRRHLEWPDR